jgi:HPt (histidine-containing phosphotransfer) domain-containing protein
MDAVTGKPVTVALLTDAITRVLAVRGRHADRPLQPLVQLPNQRASLSERLRLLADDLGEDAMREIVQTFAEDATATLLAMRAAVERGQTASVYRMAHSVAGAARNIGAEALGTKAAALEAHVGELATSAILDALATMQIDLDAALADLGIRATSA